LQSANNIKPAINKWEINQQRELLKLKSGKDYASLIEVFNSKKASLPPPPPTHSTGSISPATTESGHIVIDSDLQRMSHPHVAPLAAPTQSAAVAASTQTIRGVVKCIYWLACDVANCSAASNELCKTYGRTGAPKALTKSELARLI
jgi:hypothetical protein